ncbi:MAG: S8 family serine peptidase [Candidatus Nanoarchaeia archaeon]|nr:S8 family serine peptidase [Candidatus Nanoarchaeia archaeon]MDD5239045.1 S8 family serine peptidase [Candidatus Nanoarchaeia archaeon]
MNSKGESRLNLILNRFGASKASASLKIFLALIIFGIASAFLIYGVYAIDLRHISDGNAIAADNETIEIPAEEIAAEVSEATALPEKPQAVFADRPGLTPKEKDINAKNTFERKFPSLANEYILFLKSPMKVEGPSIASVTNSEQLQKTMSDRGIKTYNTIPELNAIIAYVPDSQIDSVNRIPGVENAEPIKYFHSLLNVSIPTINADDVWDLGYNGTGVDVCIIDTGVDKWHPSIKQATASADFTTHDWCIDLGLQNHGYDEGVFQSVVGSNRQFNMSLNVTNSTMNWLEVGVTSYYNGNWSGDEQRYDMTIFWPNNTKINDTNSIPNANMRIDDDLNYWAVLNLSIGSVTGLYTIQIDETNIGTSMDYPLVIWGSNVTWLYTNFYEYSGYICDTFNTTYSNFNPYESTDSVFKDRRAFNNIVANDDAGHGTHVAGTVASNNTTYEGVAPGANLYIAKALDMYGMGTTPGVIDAILWCQSKDVDLISMSLGGAAGQGCNDSEVVILDSVVADNMLPIIAAGNEGEHGAVTIGSPGCARNVLTIGAVNDSDVIAWFSSQGPTNDTMPRIKPEVVAPGVAIYSTIPTGRWDNMQGTSMATPHVAGLAALIRQAHPTWTPGQIKAAIINSANQTKVGFGAHNTTYGYGRVDALEAVNDTWVASINMTNDTIDSTLKMNLTAAKNLKVTIYWEENASDSHSRIYLNLTNSSGDIEDESSDRNETIQLAAVASAAAGEYHIRVIGDHVHGTKIVWIATNVPLSESIPPVLTIVSPQNATYGASVEFNVSTNEAASLCVSSLDGAANVSMGNTSLTAWNYTSSGMTSGLHNVTFYCNDTSGNWNLTPVRYFTSDISAPVVTIISPQDTTYGKTVAFNVSTSEAAAWCNITMDGIVNISMSNTSATSWAYTNSSMIDGGHNVTFRCNDLYNNTGTNLTNFTVDAVEPLITIVVPQNTTYGINVTFNITTNEAASACNFSLDGAANVSMTNISTTAWGYFKTNMAEVLHNLKFYCTDLYGNTNISATVYFSVNTSFLATITYPANQPYNTVNMTANVSTTANADVCLISIDGGANASMGNSTPTAWNYSMIDLSEDVHNLSVWCNNSGGTLATTATGSFTIDLTEPMITMVAPGNTTYGTTVVFNATTNEAASWCNFSLDETTNVSMTGAAASWAYTNSSMTNGGHNVTFYCSDLAGNANNSAIRIFTVDAILPVITINSPANTTYNTTTTLFNVTANENASWCRYSLDGAANVSMTNSSMTSWFNSTTVAENNHNVVFYCSDVYSNINSTTALYFITDTTKPVIAIVSPGNTTYANTTIWFNITVTETRPDNCVYSLDEAANATMTRSGSAWNASKNDFSGETQHNITYYCNDTAGNVNGSAMRYFVVDTVAPRVTILLPLNNTKFNNQYVNFSVNASDANILQLKMIEDNYVAQTVNLSSSGITNVTLDIGPGTHVIKANVTDSAGNYNLTDSTIVLMDTIAPVMSGISEEDINDTWVTWLVTTDENATCFVEYGTDTGYGSTTGSSTGEGSHEHTLAGIDAATLYHYRWNCTDTYNNSAVSSDYTFITANHQTDTIVNTTTTNMTFNFTEDGTNVTSAKIEISLNETIDATVKVTKEITPTANFSVSGITLIGTYYTIESDEINSTNAEWLMIKLYYEDSQVPIGINESTLRLYWYNATSSAWELVTPGGVDTGNNYVWGNTTHFSEYAIGGAADTEEVTPTSPGGSSGGIPSAGLTHEVNLDVQVTYTQAGMAVRDMINFTLNREKHVLTLTSMMLDQVVVDISSLSQRITVDMNTPKAVDLDGDGINDLELKLTKIISGRADLTLTKITATGETATPETAATQAPAEAPAEVSTEQPTGIQAVSSNYGVYIVAAIALAGLGVLIYYVFFRKR